MHVDILYKKDTLSDRLAIHPASAPAYTVHIESELKSELLDDIRNIAQGQVFLIGQKGLEQFVLRDLLQLLHPLFPEGLDAPRVILLEQGEENKNLNRTAAVFNRLIELHADRTSLILAAGGGTVGDFAGFIAATYQRGIDFIQLPTTLLAAVDSSVGGKVGVNVDLGKNMVGAFHQPRLVSFNSAFLSTLPRAEWNCGLAEMVKHAFIETSGSVFTSLEGAGNSLLDPGGETLRKAILESIAVKAWVVEQDERESGLRAVLNLGHTTGHALESATGYRRFSHGEAISRGLVSMILLSRRLAGLGSKDESRMLALMRQMQLPLDTAGLSAAEVYRHMKYDKKNVAGEPRFVLLEACGRARIGVPVHASEFESVWSEQKERFG